MIIQSGGNTDSIVDGGHRAIKYSRLHGIRSDIYPEGTHLVASLLLLYLSLSLPLASLRGTHVQVNNN